MNSKNPTNDYIEEISLIAWFWLLLFGPFYFSFKGMWGHPFGGAVLVGLTGGIAWLIYSFFSKSIIRKYYLRHGWIKIENVKMSRYTECYKQFRQVFFKRLFGL